jgi:DNA replication protein DnaC
MGKNSPKNIKYMASNINFETRDERIERMQLDNPGRPLELCCAVVDGIWDKKREMIQSRVPERFKTADVSDLGYMTKEVLDAIQEMFDPPSKNDKVGVIFCGPPGSGKTHAMYAVVNKLAENNPDMIAAVMTYSSMMSQLKHEFANNSYDEMSSVWDKLNNESEMYPGLLLIDDVSSQKLTDFEVDKIMMFLEERINSYMPFLLTTNVKQEEFKTVFGERLASRLFGYCNIVEFEEMDKRLDGKMQIS